MNNRAADELADCITQPELSDFVLGKIDRERLEQVARHVDECASCQETVIALSQQSDTFVHAIEVAKKPPANSFEGENALAVGIRRIISAVRLGGTGSQIEPLTEAFAKQQIGPYHLDSRLGMGGMGAVFKATHQKLKRVVALKLLPQDRWASSDLIARFEREMEAIGTLDHPNIVRASDAGEDDGLHFLVMEFIDGIDLSRMVRRLGRIPVADACELVRQAAIGLQYAHERSLIHRDVKPSNLMLGCQQSSGNSAATKPSVKILDMGLALLGDDHFQDEHELTTVGQMMGTLDYMSPEQGLDSHDVDARSDIFSLGATLFKLLTGKAPLDYLELKTPLKKITTLATKHLPSIRESRADLPEELNDLVDRMLSRDPDDRPSSAREVADALTPFAAESNLSTLLSRSLAANETEPDSAIARGALSMALEQIPPEPIGKATRAHSGWWWPIATALFVTSMAIAFGVFYLATDKGRIRVESIADDIQIEVRQNDRFVNTIEVASGEGKNGGLKVYSGKYELVLKDAGDGLKLSHDSVTVTRNGEAIVKVIRESASPVASADNPYVVDRASPEDDRYATSPSPAPRHVPDSEEPKETYDGQTYAQWMTVLKTERKAERMLEAVNALHRLATEDQAAEATKAILQTMRVYGSRSADNSPQGKLIQRVAELLHEGSESDLIAAIEEEIRHGNQRSRAFLPWIISSSPLNPQATRQKITRHSERLANTLDELIPGPNRRWAIEQLVTLFQLDETLGKRRPDLLAPLLETAINRELGPNSAWELRAGLVKTLARHADKGEVPKVIAYAIELLEAREPETRLAAVQSLKQIGTDAASATSALITTLTEELNAEPPYMAAMGGMGGGGLGGMGGGGFATATFGGGMGGHAIGRIAEKDGKLYYSTAPDLRIEIVKALDMIGQEAADELAKQLTPMLLTGTDKRSKALMAFRQLATAWVVEAAGGALSLLSEREKIVITPSAKMKQLRTELESLIDGSANATRQLDENVTRLKHLTDSKLISILSDESVTPIWEQLNKNLSTTLKSYLGNVQPFEQEYSTAINAILAKSDRKPQVYVDALALAKTATLIASPTISKGPTRNSRGNAQTPRAGTPTKPVKSALFRGKTFDQWMESFEDERDPAQLLSAVEAITTLSEGDDAKRTAATFFKLMRRYRTRRLMGIDGNADPRYTLTTAIEAAIWQLPVNAVVDAFVAELASPNVRSRAFIAWLINPTVDSQSEFHLVKPEFRATLRAREDTIVKHLIANAKGQSIPALRQYYIDRLVDLRRFVQFNPEENDEFIPLLQANVKSERFDMYALGTLVEIAPKSEGLALRLLDILSASWPDEQNSRVLFMALGRDARNVVPNLIERLEERDSDPSIYIELLASLGADAKPALPAINRMIEANPTSKRVVQWTAARDQIEKGTLHSEPSITVRNDVRRLMQTPREVPGSQGGGGMGGGMF